MKPQKEDLADKVAPEPPAKHDGSEGAPTGSDEPEQVIRPEDEALVVERLRELGYIE